MICRSVGTSGRLNVFQQVMLQWSELHPYNAAHVYRLTGPLDIDALREAICGAFCFNGLGVVELSEDGSYYYHEADDSPDLEALPATASLDQQLDAE